MAFLGFDVEISKVFELGPGEDFEDYAPFDISVAATHLEGGESRLWLSHGPDGTPLTNLTCNDARDLLDHLEQMQADEHKIVAWNGLSFDLRWLGHVTGDLAKASRIALKSYDPMFQFFKIKGFPVSLAKVGEGMRIKTTKIMDGADAPKEWRAGNHERVCDYVTGDARMTVEIVSAIARSKRIVWVTRRGTPDAVSLPSLRTVEECLGDPMPDQSWMDAPLPQEKFAGWLTA